MPKLRLIIKGPRFSAQIAAWTRGIPILPLYTTPLPTEETVALCPASCEAKVARWFTSDSAPFPQGSLLFYTPHQSPQSPR